MSSPPTRLVSLDAMRGAIIALMVLVNTAGGLPQAYEPLKHAEWHGWTLTDVVFPSFVWIVGLSLTLSLGKRLASGATPGSLVGTILKRGLIIYLLGVLLYLTPHFDFATARLLGVLQRIAICYVAASLIYLWTGVRGQVIWIIGLCGVYWILMMTMPVPGYPPGQLDEPGNFAHYVDSIVLGPHNYASTGTWDPEGIVSTLPAIASALLGVLAARLLKSTASLAERTTWLFLIGNALIVAALVCEHWLPINKKLWTTSFTLLVAGIDFALFAGALWVIDGQGYKRFARPFVILGMNAIAVYLASEFGEIFLSEIWKIGGVPARTWIYENLYASWLGPLDASLLYALSYVALMLGIAGVLYRKNWFLKV